MYNPFQIQAITAIVFAVTNIVHFEVFVIIVEMYVLINAVSFLTTNL